MDAKVRTCIGVKLETGIYLGSRRQACCSRLLEAFWGQRVMSLYPRRSRDPLGAIELRSVYQVP